jgi:tetratricopeptide (TPR) repeat protein
LREQGKYAQSIQEFKKVIKSNSRYLYAQVQLGVTLYAAGKASEAVKQWRHVLKREKDHEGARMYLRLAEGAA